MTKDEIINIAIQAGFWNGLGVDGLDELSHFAKLVAEKAIKEALAQPTPAEYAMGYAEGFEDGCKPKPEQEPLCIYPDCNCPMGAGPEPDWCARGYKHKEQK